MNSLKRFGLVFVLALAMGTSFGCAKKQTVADEAPAPVEATEDSSAAIDRAAQVISDGIVYFAFDKFDIQPQYQDILRQKADLLKQYPSIRVRIEGNCDARGTEEYNLALGGRRARAAYDYMVRLGVSPDQLETISYGKERPAVEGSGEEVWAQNRRDEFQILAR